LGVDKNDEKSRISVIQIVNELQFKGIKHNATNFVNTCLVFWAMGLRPIQLMFHIPSPLSVLKQQASGQRVLTMFVSLSELGSSHLSPLAYMEGGLEHSRDALEFFVHDCKHMEHFACPDIHKEQVGFFACMLRLGGGCPRKFFDSRTIKNSNLKSLATPSTRNFRVHLSFFYCRNCFSTHLIRYLFAKMQLASERKVSAFADNGKGEENLSTDIKINWEKLLNAFGMQNEELAFKAAMSLIPTSFKEKVELSAESGEYIRIYFISNYALSVNS
jgi:hypothetical protein